MEEEFPRHLVEDRSGAVSTMTEVETAETATAVEAAEEARAITSGRGPIARIGATDPRPVGTGAAGTSSTCKRNN